MFWGAAILRKPAMPKSREKKRRTERGLGTRDSSYSHKEITSATRFGAKSGTKFGRNKVLRLKFRHKGATDTIQLQIDVLNSIPAGVWAVMPDGRCDFVNHFYLEAMGLTADFCMAPPESWKGSPQDLPPFLSGLHPEHRERVSEIFWNGIRSGTEWAFDAPFLQADDLYHWHLNRAIPLRDTQGKISRFVGTCTAIEELKFAQDSLEESERRLRAIIDNSPNLIFVKDIEDRYLLVNKKFETVVGIPRSQIVGKRNDDMFAEGQAAIFRINSEEVVRAGATMQFEESVLTDKGEISLIVEKFPLFDAKGKIFASGGIAVDVSKFKAALERLGLAEEKAKFILDTALDAVVNIDSTGTITDWNKIAEHVFGWSRGEAVGRRIADTIVPPSLRAGHMAGLKRFVETGEGPILNKRIEIEALHRDGHEFPVELTIAPVKIGTSWNFSAFIRDLTEKKKNEVALRTARDDLMRVTRLTAMGQLSAAIAHEINQPLAAIVMNSETCLRWLRDGQMDIAKATAAAERISRDARRASEIIAHIRSLMNKTGSERTPLDINVIVKRVLELTNVEMSRHQISVHTDLASSIPQVIGDPIQLQQVILNLILNGVEAMLGIQHRPKVLKIETGFDKSKTINVSVHDSGIGLDPTILDQIFDPFFTTKSKGTGMGLSICRSIIEAHEGQLMASHGIPHGAVFIINLPASL